ncbi:hypothetical protein TKK_0001095 [Trichogramma kaykai]
MKVTDRKRKNSKTSLNVGGKRTVRRVKERMYTTDALKAALNEIGNMTHKDNRPGTEWFKAFLGHHKKLFECIGQNLTTTRCSVTEEDLRGWFKHVSESLKTKNLLKIDASRVFNLDESAFALVPKDNNVITKKGASNNFSSDGKKSLTILFTVCEDGRMLHLSRFLLAGQLAIQNLGG